MRFKFQDEMNRIAREGTLWEHIVLNAVFIGIVGALVLLLIYIDRTRGQ